MSNQEVHVKFAGKIIFVGFGSIGQGVLPLILRHIGTSADRITIVTAEDAGRAEAEQFGVKFVKTALTRDNYRQMLQPLLGAGDFLLNLSVDVSSVALILLARERGALYLDTCIEPWAGVLRRSEARRRDAQQLRHAHGGFGAARFDRECADGRCDPRSESRAGIASGQAGAAQHRQGHGGRRRQAGEPRAMGEACPDIGNQGHSRRRAGHAGRERAQENGRVRQHLVGGRFRERGRSTRRARLGDARAAFPRRRRQAQSRLGLRHLFDTARARALACGPGPPRPDPSTAF